MAAIPGFSSAPGAYATPAGAFGFRPEYAGLLDSEPPPRDCRPAPRGVQPDPAPTARPAAKDLEESEDSRSEAETAHGKGAPVSSRQQGLACAAMLLLALVACTPIALVFGSHLLPPGAEVQSDTAYGLFRSQELVDIAADNVLASTGADASAEGRRLADVHPAQRERVRAIVVAGFQDIDDRIRAQYPLVHRGLREAHMSAAQRDAVLNAMRHMRDPRVQGLGRSLLRAASPGFFHRDVALLKIAVLKHVQSFFREARALRDEILPASLREQSGNSKDPADHREPGLLRSFERWCDDTHSTQQQVARRLFTWPFPGKVTKIPYTVQGQGMVLGGLANTTVTYMMGQGKAFFHQLGGQFSYLGLDTVTDKIFGGQGWEDFKQCAVDHLQKLDPVAEAKCFTTFANVAYDEIMQTNFSRIMRQKFPPLPTARPLPPSSWSWMKVSTTRPWWMPKSR